MGYSLTTSLARPCAHAPASPKTHTPLPRLQERGLRYYSAELSRWFARDPIGEEGGVGVYGFLDNSPINYVDPTGEKILSLEIHHSGKAEIPDAEYQDTVEWHDYFDQIFPGDLGFREKLVPKHVVYIPDPWGGPGSVKETRPARRAVGFKFEYVVQRECVGEDYKKDFKLTQTIVDGHWWRRKKGKQGNWQDHPGWSQKVPSMPHADGPSLIKYFPALPKVKVVAGDMPRDMVDQGDKWEYWLTVTWKVRAEDADNAFEGKHRISMFYDEDGCKGGAWILAPPKEVK